MGATGTAVKCFLCHASVPYTPSDRYPWSSSSELLVTCAKITLYSGADWSSTWKGNMQLLQALSSSLLGNFFLKKMDRLINIQQTKFTKTKVVLRDQVCHEREREERCGKRGSREAACPSSSSCEPFFLLLCDICTILTLDIGTACSSSTSCKHFFLLFDYSDPR